MGFLKEPGEPGLFDDEDERESPWLIDQDQEEMVREKAAEKDKSPGEVFREAVEEGVQNL